MADLDHYVAVNREANASGIHVKKRLVDLGGGVYADATAAIGPDGTVASPAASLTTGQNALSTTAELVVAANPFRRFAEVKNADAVISVYVGKDTNVTAANGHLLKAGEAFGFSGYSGAIWAIAASGTPTVTFIEW